MTQREAKLHPVPRRARAARQSRHVRARTKGLRLSIGDMRAMPLCDGPDILVNPFASTSGLRCPAGGPAPASHLLH